MSDVTTDAGMTGHQASLLAAGLENQVLNNASSSFGLVTLPCGYLDKDGTLHTEAVVREITGEEEDMLAARKVPDYRKFSELLTRCVERIGPYTERKEIAAILPELLLGDRTHLLFQIRIASLGPIYEIFEKCPDEDCQKENYFQVDLTDLEVIKMPDPMNRERVLQLPRSKKSVTVRFLNGRLEEAVAREKEDGRSAGILHRVLKLDNRSPTMADIKRLTLMDRNFLTDFFDREEGGVNTSQEYECNESAGGCGLIFKKELSLQRGFFFPSSEKTRNS